MSKFKYSDGGVESKQGPENESGQFIINLASFGGL